MADLSQFLYGQEQIAQAEAPPGVRVPWQGLPPQKADEARLRAAEQARKKIEENAKVVQQGATVLQDMETFGALNRENRTGEWYTGLQPTFLKGAPEQEMDAITSRLAPGQRIEGSGTTSDRDIAMFVKAVPSIDKKGSVNQSIRDNFARQYEKSQAKLQFLQDYYDQYGHLNGADTVWQKNYASKFIKDDKSNKNQQGAKSSIFNAADAIIGGQ